MAIMYPRARLTAPSIRSRRLEQVGEHREALVRWLIVHPLPVTTAFRGTRLLVCRDHKSRSNRFLATMFMRTPYCTRYPKRRHERVACSLRRPAYNCPSDEHEKRPFRAEAACQRSLFRLRKSVL